MRPDEPTHHEEILDALLAPAPPAGNAALRQALLEQTARRVRSHYRMRLFGRFAVVVGAFAAGVGATMWLREPRLVDRIAVVNVPKDSEPAPPPGRVTPAEVELEAERTLVKDESSRLFREAGDRYLREEANLEAALRCYRNFLDETNDADLTVNDSDTWLLTSLKNARRRETENDP